jgi:hypothetical protein
MFIIKVETLRASRASFSQNFLGVNLLTHLGTQRKKYIYKMAQLRKKG